MLSLSTRFNRQLGTSLQGDAVRIQCDTNAHPGVALCLKKQELAVSMSATENRMKCGRCGFTTELNKVCVSLFDIFSFNFSNSPRRIYEHRVSITDGCRINILSVSPGII